MTNEASSARQEYMRRYRKKNRTRLNEYQRKWRRENPERCAKYIETYWSKKVNGINNFDKI